MPRRTTLLAVAALALLGTAPACGEGEAADACGPVVVEQLDPNQGHLVGDVTEPSYLTDPPTSGPHTPGLRVSGVVNRPLRPIEQVGTLEEGAVIIQYRDAHDAVTLRPLASDRVVVAPAPALSARVIATGWARKLTCDRVDEDRLRAFVDEVVGRYDGHGSSTTTAGN